MSTKLRRAKRKNGLRTRIERTRELPKNDSYDADVLPHIVQFLSQPLPKLEQFSLLTPESAAQALSQINKTHELLQERLRMARTLRRLCEDVKAKGSEG
jgi:hypothetical protein